MRHPSHHRHRRPLCLYGTFGRERPPALDGQPASSPALKKAIQSMQFHLFDTFITPPDITLEQHPYYQKRTPEQRKDCLKFLTLILTEEINATRSREYQSSVFDGKATVTLEQYIEELSKLNDYLKAPELSLEHAVFYCLRFSQKQFETHHIGLNDSNIFRLLLIVNYISQKMLADKPPRLQLFAALVGMQPSDLCKLEREFLTSMSYRLFVSEEDFLTFFDNLMKFEEKSPPDTTVTASSSCAPI